MPDTPFALFDLEGAATAVHIPPPPVRHAHELRIVADANDRVAWIRERSRGITATDAAKLSSRAAVRSAAWEKLHGTGGFGGSRFTDHGRRREPVIAEWVRCTHGIEPSSLLFHAASDRRHLATPDGLSVADDGTPVLCEIKTTSRPWRGIPRGYLRQVWWQQYVLGAERTLVVWEQHDDFRPVGDEPRCRWVDRDDDQIAILVRLADELLLALRPDGVAREEPSYRSFYRPGPLA